MTKFHPNQLDPTLEQIPIDSDDPDLRFALTWAARRASAALRQRLRGHADAVNAVALLPDGESVLSGSSDGTLMVWDLASGEPQKVLSGHTDWISDVAVSADGSWAVSASRDGTLRRWDLASGAPNGHPTQVFRGHTDWCAPSSSRPMARA